MLLAPRLAGGDSGAAAALEFAERGVAECSRRAAAASRDEVVYLEQAPAGGSGVALTACGLVEAPPAAVWPALRDCERYQEFLPGVDESALRERSQGVAVCEAVIGLPFPLGELRSVERAAEEERADGGFERRWSLVSGNYRRLEGSWTLVPWGEDGRSTLAVYQLDMALATLIPDFLLRRAQASTAPGLFAAIRARVANEAASSSRLP